MIIVIRLFLFLVVGYIVKQLFKLNFKNFKVKNLK